jgi:hypothetical protein
LGCANLRTGLNDATDLRKKLTVLPFVICIKSSKPKSITTGKVYQVLEEREGLDEVFIVNDRGQKEWYHGDHFINIDLPESKAKYLTEV